MTLARKSTRLLATGAAIICLGAGLSAQSRDDAAPSAAALSAEVRELRAEIRGLREDLTREAAVVRQTQLFIVSLSIQQERVATLDRQHAIVAEQLARVVADRSATQTRLSEIDRDFSGASTQAREAARSQLQSVLGQQLASEQQLIAQEGDLARSLAAEQDRLADMDHRLEQMAGTAR